MPSIFRISLGWGIPAVVTSADRTRTMGRNLLFHIGIHAFGIIAICKNQGLCGEEDLGWQQNTAPEMLLLKCSQRNPACSNLSCTVSQEQLWISEQAQWRFPFSMEMKRKVFIASASVTEPKSHPGAGMKLLLTCLVTLEGFQCNT